MILDACGLILAFQSAYWTRFSCAAFTSIFPPLKGIPEHALYQQTLWALLPTWLLVFFYLRFYRDVLSSAYDEFILVMKGVILCALLTTAMTFAYRGAEYSRLVIGLWTAYSVLMVYGLRECDKIFFRRLLEHDSGPRHVLVIGKGKAADLIRDLSAKQPFLRTSFMETLPATQSMDHYCETHHISEVLLIQGSVPSESILEMAKLCELHGLECKILPDLLEMRRGELRLDGFCGLPTFSIKSASLYGADYYLKRSFDVAGSLLILTALFIPLLVISVIIRLDSPGPALFSQERMGFLGRKFKLYKFRTMITDADTHIDKLKHLSDRSGPVFKMKHDPRVTHAGKWLRRFSLDEIPQILNVLKGDMSLVGPRPQVLWEAAHYDEHAKKRLHVKPGITGLWQVSGRAALSYDEMIDLDVFYLENWSLGLDLKILLRTLPAVFAKEGAY